MKTLLLSTLVAAAVSSLVAADAKISVQVDRPGHAVSPELFGLFFEDINLSADGGVYPELVRNRSFEDAGTPENWTIAGARATLDASRPLNPLNRTSLRLPLDGPVTLTNEGYWGMNIVKGGSYTLKFAARALDGFNGPITARLLGADGKVLATGEITGLGPDWKYQTLDLVATGDDPKAKLQLSASGKGTLFLDMVSLLPKETWGGSRLRPDLAGSMAALKPAFLRFPGGCWVEGETMARMYNWKKTVGAVDTRTPLYNIWQYNATHGIGFHEYLLMAEDLGAEPLFCINVGMSHRENVPMDRMDQWVQDALDAIEYANGPVDSVWGGVRARNGHPAPFNLKYLEIGNENGHAAYAERWPLFVKAIKAKYPDIQLIANHWAGGYPKEPMPAIVDEHYYNSPEWFLAHASHYDRYDRQGPKIFVGEYAVTEKAGAGNLRGAIGEAAFMTGLERNSDVVTMAAYAPLFCNANHKRWPINLINFDSSRWFGIPSYYVQKLFAENRGSVVLPITVEAPTVSAPAPSGGIGVGTWRTAVEFRNIKVTAPDGKVLFASDFSKNFDGWRMFGGGMWSVQDGALRQTAESEEANRALIGDPSWTDYTLTLEARKISGAEGFRVIFHGQKDESRPRWNLGASGNTESVVEAGDASGNAPLTIDRDRWYDVKIELLGTRITLSLDGKLIQEFAKPALTYKTLAASATRDDRTGDIILKVVNAAAIPTETEIDLAGTGRLGTEAQVTVLTSASPLDENTLDEPTKVTPRTKTVKIPDGRFVRSFPGNSLTILRIPANKTP